MILFTSDLFHKAKHPTKLTVWNTEAATWSCAHKKAWTCLVDWILHHDNAPAHKTLSVKQFLAQKSIAEMEHPPYSLI
jgi:hypothetical protein